MGQSFDPIFALSVFVLYSHEVIIVNMYLYCDFLRLDYGSLWQNEALLTLCNSSILISQ